MKPKQIKGFPFKSYTPPKATVIPVNRETSRKPNLPIGYPEAQKDGNWQDNIGTNIKLV